MKGIGIDLGSRQVKIVVMSNKKILEKKVLSTVNFYRNFCTYDGKITVNLEALNLDEKYDYYISTGYGRNNTDLNYFKTINEIKAHVYGGLYSTNYENFILLDIGGQDVKVVSVEKKVITDLKLNDKCAASCGRYLENMAQVLEISLEELALYYKNPLELNSTCAVFSESELIGKIAEGVNINQLCSSVNYSLYKRLKPLLNNFYGKRLIVSGGVARNKAIKKFLKSDYEEVISLKEPEYNGAVGCCYYGLVTGGNKNVYIENRKIL